MVDFTNKTHGGCFLRGVMGLVLVERRRGCGTPAAWLARDETSLMYQEARSKSKSLTDLLSY